MSDVKKEYEQNQIHETVKNLKRPTAVLARRRGIKRLADKLSGIRK
jgi:hypothetical protein